MPVSLMPVIMPGFCWRDIGHKASKVVVSAMCLSRGGFLHGGVPPVGRVHLWLSRVVFGNIGDVGRVEGSA